MRHSLGLKGSSAVAEGNARAITLRIAREFFKCLEKVHLLDVGCGASAFSRSLPPLFETTGVDNNNIASTHVDVSYERLPFTDGAFDMVTAWQVFEHLENPFFAGREIERVLRPSGICLLSVPNIRHIRTRISFLLHGNILRWSKHNDHIFVPLKSVLKKAVFSNCRLMWCGYHENSRSLLSSLVAKNTYYIFQKL